MHLADQKMSVETDPVDENVTFSEAYCPWNRPIGTPILDPHDSCWLSYRDSIMRIGPNAMVLEDKFVTGWQYLFPLPPTFIRLPIVLESSEYFYWLGFRQDMSDLLFERWMASSTAWDSYYSMVAGRLFALAFEHLEQHGVFDLSGSLDDWERNLINAGVRKYDVVSSYMNPHLIKLHGTTQSPKQLFMNMLHIREKILQNVMTQSSYRSQHGAQLYTSHELRCAAIRCLYNLSEKSLI